MTEIKRKRGSAQEVEESAGDAVQADLTLVNRPLSMDKVVSTGSTLLDLAISGKRRREGGIPGGIFVEFFGPSGAGKTALIAEICASAQHQSGEVQFCDPEARLDQEYTQIYGVSLKDRFTYFRPDTVLEMFDLIRKFSPSNPDAINVVAGDSLAALSTETEMEEEDKRGQMRAKEFSAQLRKTCRLIANNNWLCAFTNQIRMGDKGFVTPGGMGLPFYASLRIKVEPLFQKSKITRKVKLDSGPEVEKTIGIHSVCTIVKSSVDEPFRTAPLSIVFGYGIDTIRDELQFFKDMTNGKSYDCIVKSSVSMEKAIEIIEENDLQAQLKDRTITLWNEIQDKFALQRTPKRR